MSYVDLDPTSDEAEKRMLAVVEDIQQILRICIGDEWGVPPNDIIIMAHRNTVVFPDPIAKKLGAIPDLVIKINTSDTQLQEKAAQLRDRIVEAWKISFGTTYPMEVWIDFFHTWGCTIDFT